MPATRSWIWFAGAFVVISGMALIESRPAWATTILPEDNAQVQTIPPRAEKLTPVPYNGQPGAIPQEGSLQPVAPQSVTPQTATEDEETECCQIPYVGPPGRFWLRTDYLMWWTNGMRLPALVTSSPLGTPADEAGVLGFPNTTTLYGDKTVDNGGRSGYRTTLGMKLGECSRWDVQFDYLSLGDEVGSFNRVSAGDVILARPFFNVELNQQASLLVAYPGTSEGSISVKAREYFQSAGVTFCYNVSSNDMSAEWSDGSSNAESGEMPLTYGSRTDLLVGLRYYNLFDSVIIDENTSDISLGSTLTARDIFRNRNDFYGSEIGFRSLFYRGRWSLEVMTKIAMGNNHQIAIINGNTVITAPNQPTQTYNNVGILAGPSNEGIYNRDVFTMIPQVNLELGYQFNCHCRAFIGYNVLYWGNVMRAADQIDLNVAPGNFAPQTPAYLPFPAFSAKTSSFWAQGVNVGTEIRF